ncbi:phage tail protein [Pseudomonas sp. B21-009]|uniref:phage tail protein n=1 Tax=Pseudomonas sp. B21-009 TaxID=2895470 RepID=UPI00216074C6|nr:phage tail protein [Pseudomonas sp. B21-009]UVM64409.1 phage tail protein [Pseudomonas sp. B21-009]
MGAAQKLDIVGAKGGSDKPKQPTEAPDSLRSVAVAKMLIAVGEGEFEGTPTARDIYLDSTPLADPAGNLNFPNVKWEWRTGSVEQGHIPGIPSIENEISESVELRSDNAYIRAIDRLELSAIRLRFAWPMLQSIDEGGNVNGYRIEYAVDLATDGGAYQQVLLEAVDGKTTSTYERTRRIDLPKATGGWLLRVRRLTPNQNNNKIADTMQIVGRTEVIDAKVRYPNTALLYIEFSAEQFRNIPAVTVDCDARKFQVPSNYDPRTRVYTGVWDGTFKEAWTDNPAWHTYGITVNDRFGLGRRIKPWQVDKWELYRIAQYCDQSVPNGKGGQEPRFICNLNLQSKADAWSLLRDISAIYRGMTYWAQGQVYSLADMPRDTDFDFAYTRANVIDGKFTYSSASERTRYSRALISYDNPANSYDTDVTSVTDQKLQRRYGDNVLEISAIGCTRESEAQRRGKWALLTNSRDRGITFKVGLDGRIPLPGYVIPVADELLAGRAIGGRISAVSGRTIGLDRDTQAKAGDRLILNLPDGTCQARTVQSVSGRAVTVTTVYSVAPEPELVWALDADDLAVPLYRVTSVTRPEPGVFEISAVQYDPSKFAHIDTGARLEERPISVIPITVVPPPASVALTSSYAVDQGIAVSTMTIAWPAVNGAVAYDVEWRKDNGNWIKLQRTGATSVDVTGIYAGAYLARVRAVSAFDISSIWKSSSLTQLTGKAGLPPAVSFLNTTPLVYGIKLAWGFPAGTEDTQRTEIWYSKTTSRDDAIKLGDFAYPQAEHEMHGLAAGVSFFFWARLIDRTGNIGPWFPAGVGVNGQSSSDQSEYEEYFKDKIGNGALYPALREEIEKISGDGPGSVNDRLEELNEQLQEQIGNLVDALEYDPAKPYLQDDAVRLGQRLYQAKQPVPADPSGANAPPNPLYWLDIGQVVQSANGLAAQVQENTAGLSDLDGVVTAQATSLQSLQAAWRADVDDDGGMSDANAAWDAQAGISEQRKVFATEQQASAERFIAIDAKVGQNAAGLSTLEKAVATQNEATATRLDQLKAEVDDNAADIQEVSEAQVTTDQAVASMRTSVEAVYTAGRDDTGEGDLLSALDAQKSQAKFASDVRILADADQALARKTETLEASIGETSASVQQVSEALVGVDGRVSAMTTIKAQTTSGGRTVMAGLALGSNGETSEILAFAQRFAVVDEVSGQLSVPFVVQNGQVFINQAFISQAFIKEIILGMTLRSAAVNSQGLPLLEINVPAGTLILRGQDADGSTLLNNGGHYVYDANGKLRTATGRLVL